MMDCALPVMLRDICMYLKENGCKKKKKTFMVTNWVKSLGT